MTDMNPFAHSKSISSKYITGSVRNRRHPIVGLDIGTTAIKAVGLKRCAERVIISGFGIEPVAATATSADPGIPGKALTAGIRHAVNAAAPGARVAATALPDEEAITRMLEVPAGLDDRALHTRVSLDIEASLKQPRHELVCDFRRLAVDPDSGKQPVRVVAARAEALTRRQRQLKAAGLQCRLVDLDSHAIARAALADPRLHTGPDDPPIALLDIGTRLHLTVFDRQRIHYRQDHALGGRPDDDDRLRGIEQALAMHHGSSDARAPDVLGLTGGAITSSLADALGRRLASRCQRIDPLHALETDEAVDTDTLAGSMPRLLTAIGLALHAGDPNAHWR
ncbi:type IV pilus biogenesis protein PilM [Spiribacter vilamensis]|uniref:type IV pilus biogenesis protein PilM n=1 Tax=Spiribacter vilamensis TaxID=531306 RepID=UPI00102ADBF4|nr:pilus assembly protein PilM [Spiribacter vilamensis]TVO61751.1 hypothetical protein FPL09_06480 [Spiribacter vilamensis]